MKKVMMSSTTIPPRIPPTIVAEGCLAVAFGGVDVCVCIAVKVDEDVIDGLIPDVVDAIRELTDDLAVDNVVLVIVPEVKIIVRASDVVTIAELMDIDVKALLAIVMLALAQRFTAN